MTDQMGMGVPMPKSTKSWRAVFVVVAACSGWGCVGSTEPDPPGGSPTLETDRATYQASPMAGSSSYRWYGFTLVARYTNQTARTVYLARCYPDSKAPIYSLRGVGFASAYDGAWACVGHDNPIRVEAGRSRTDTLRIQGPTAWSDGRPIGELQGVFELVYYGTWSCPGGCGQDAPDGTTASRPFAVVVP